MRKSLILLPLLVLAACASPRQTCISGASRELAVVDQLIAETEQNIARGYGTERRQEVRTIPRTCRNYRPDGTYDIEICDTTVVRNYTVPVTLDIDAERAKLRQLKQQRARLEAPTQAAIQQCIATYPE
jgi:hypothetical protein